LRADLIFRLLRSSPSGETPLLSKRLQARKLDLERVFNCRF
jgi:hypothetical protein